MRLFLAHPKRMSDEEIEWWVKAVMAQFHGEYPDAQVVPGRDDYAMFGPSAGTFQTWAVDVVTRSNGAGGLFYDAIVVTGRTIGAATRIIVNGAMASNIPVLVAEKNDADTGAPVEFAPAREVITENDQDYVNGWWIDT